MTTVSDAPVSENLLHITLHNLLTITSSVTDFENFTDLEGI